jgi:hypothetical protein
MKNPVVWLFHASMLILGTVIALNLGVAFLRPILPWLIGGALLAGMVWLAIAIVRWRRSRW